MQWRSCATKLTELCQKILPLVISVVLGNHIPGWCLSFLSVKWGCEATLICTNVLKACVLKDGGFPSGSGVKNPPAIQETQKTRVISLGWEDPLEEEGMATHSSILAWRIPWTEKTSRLSCWHICLSKWLFCLSESRETLRWVLSSSI